MPRIAEFLDLYPKVNTRRAYQAGIRLFFDVTFKHKRVNDKAVYEDLADRYFHELEQGTRSLATDLLALATSLEASPPKTAHIRVAAVKEFFANYGIELSTRETKNLNRRVPKAYAQTEEAELTKETLRVILQHCELKSRAPFLMLVSSGMRVGEVVQITLKDIHLDKEPVEVHIRAHYTKTGEKRTVFISNEAAEAVREWLKIRDPFIKSSKRRNAGLVAGGRSREKKPDDNRLFPFAYKVLVTAWTSAVKKAGLFTKDETTGRMQLHPHMLRKYFRTNAAVKIPVDVTEALMGHGAYLSQAYRRYTHQQLVDYYKKAESALTIQPNEISDEIRAEMADQQKSIARLALKNEQLEGELRSLQKIMELAIQKSGTKK